MNVQKLKSIAVLFIFLFLLAMPMSTTGANMAVASIEALSTTPHLTISVNNDTQLSELIASNGWNGNGTEGNPYVIEGLDIDAQGAPNAIFIGGTTQHLIIRGCFLHNTTYGLGSLPNNGNCGATIYNARNVTLEQNVCTGSGRGLALYQSANVTISNNTCYGNVHGIGLYYSHDNFLVGNNCTSDATDGIHFEESTGNAIESNRVIMNGRYGICLVSNCNSNLVANNTVANNSNAGIRFSTACSLNLVMGNLITGNLGYGFSLLSSNDNEIHGNVIRENRGATSEFNPANVQGFDSGNNHWNSTAYGNRWGDWREPDANGDGIVDASYKIDGGSNYDQLPIAATFVLILNPINGETVNTSMVIVSGSADPDYPLWINGALVYVETNGSFSYPINLAEGQNLIKARSLHPLGEVSDSVNITYFNELRAELDELNDRMDEMNQRVDDLNETLNEALESLGAAQEELNDRMDEMDQRVDDLNETLNGALESLGAAMENITLLDDDLNGTLALLSQTREWLSAVEDQLVDCYGDQNLTAGEVSSLLEQVSALRASLIDQRNSLNLTDDQAVVTEAALNAAIANLSSAEDQLESLRSDVDELQEDQLPLILGVAGLVLGALALVLFALVYTRKIKLP